MFGSFLTGILGKLLLLLAVIVVIVGFFDQTNGAAWILASVIAFAGWYLRYLSAHTMRVRGPRER